MESVFYSVFAKEKCSLWILDFDFYSQQDEHKKTKPFLHNKRIFVCKTCVYTYVDGRQGVWEENSDFSSCRRILNFIHYSVEWKFIIFKCDCRTRIINSNRRCGMSPIFYCATICIIMDFNYEFLFKILQFTKL